VGLNRLTRVHFCLTNLNFKSPFLFKFYLSYFFALESILDGHYYAKTDYDTLIN
jgi:hypothetical protein